MAIEKLHKAKRLKNDEFYTQYEDIEAEMNAYIEYNQNIFKDKNVLCPCDDPEWSNFTRYFVANFKRLGLKKLISTSYAKGAANRNISAFERNSPAFNRNKHDKHGRIYILDRDTVDIDTVNIDNLQFDYLNGDGDFRSEEVTQLRNNADIIVTNGPFSLFREFLKWIIDGKKLFSIIGNQNAITYKEVIPLIKENKIWLGASIHSGGRNFRIPDDCVDYSDNVIIKDNGHHYINLAGVRWFTNIDHGIRHEPLQLITMKENLKYNQNLRKKCKKENWIDENGVIFYPRYDNYNALEIPITISIPDDYNDVMGVPITFLDKYCPEQFDILGFWNTGKAGANIGAKTCKAKSGNKEIYWNGPTINGKTLYFRILIKKKDKPRHIIERYPCEMFTKHYGDTIIAQFTKWYEERLNEYESTNMTEINIRGQYNVLPYPFIFISDDGTHWNVIEYKKLKYNEIEKIKVILCQGITDTIYIEFDIKHSVILIYNTNVKEIPEDIKIYTQEGSLFPTPIRIIY